MHPLRMPSAETTARRVHYRGTRGVGQTGDVQSSRHGCLHVRHWGRRRHRRQNRPNRRSRRRFRVPDLHFAWAPVRVRTSQSRMPDPPGASWPSPSASKSEPPSQSVSIPCFRSRHPDGRWDHRRRSLRRRAVPRPIHPRRIRHHLDRDLGPGDLHIILGKHGESVEDGPCLGVEGERDVLVVIGHGEALGPTATPGCRRPWLRRGPRRCPTLRTDRIRSCDEPDHEAMVEHVRAQFDRGRAASTGSLLPSPVSEPTGA